MSVVIRDSVHQTEVHRVGTCSAYRRLLQLLGRIIMQKAYGRFCAEADAPQFDCKSLHKGGISHYKSLHQQVIASACFSLFPLLSSYTPSPSLPPICLPFPPMAWGEGIKDSKDTPLKHETRIPEITQSDAWSDKRVLDRLLLLVFAITLD